MRPTHAIKVVATLAALVGSMLPALPATAGGPATWRYPSIDCPDTGDQGLQDCIDAAEAGSTIVLVSEVIEENAHITKSLTLRAVDRELQPVLAAAFVDDAGVGSSIHVTIEDIRFQRGIFATALDEGSDHRLTIRRVEVGKGSSLARGIQVVASVPVSVTVEDSYIRTLGNEEDALLLYTDRPSGTTWFRALGNRITQRGGDDSSSGIHVTLAGGGTSHVELHGNRIFDVARSNAGGASGIHIDVDGAVVGHVDVVGNTVARSATSGFSVRNDLADAGRLSLDLYNNTFTHSRSGIQLDDGDAGSTSVRAGHNNTFANPQGDHFDVFPRGTGNLRRDPRFLDLAAGDLRLTAASPLIDAGLTCSPGGIVERDAAGNFRLRGPSVDIGAYERGATPPTGVVRLGGSGPDVLTGTAGDDILCGYGGADRLSGKGGRDHLDGGSGGDLLVGGAGPDTLLGGPGADTLCARDGVRGNDRADGGAGVDGGRTDPGDTRISLEGSASC